jgi:EAL domain-containing protein (putative c-di-GMP-specific phosphodiesterase class I)
MTPLELAPRTAGFGRALAKTAGDRLRSALVSGDPVMHFQPILDLRTGRIRGWEALARFPHMGGSPPDLLFALAHESGFGPELEVAAVRRALQDSARRPAGTLMSINLSPSTLPSVELALAWPDSLVGVQVEVTEHERVLDMPGLLRTLDQLRERGARIAVDDVGEGYAGLQQVMAMAPDSLKLDRTLITGIDTNPAKAALVKAIVDFASHTGADVCAEGIETPGELALLADLDVSHGQGWLIGRPDRALLDVSAVSRGICVDAMHQAVRAGDLGESHGDLVPALLRVGSATSLAGLARAMNEIAPSLGAQHVELSYLGGDGTYVEALLDTVGVFKGIRYVLTEFPLTAEVLRDDVAAQVVLGALDADESESTWMREDSVGSLLMVPVRAGGRVVGLLECHQVLDQPFRRWQMRAARMVSAVAGPVLVTLLND